MDVLFHFSEDPGIEVFVPHVPATNPEQPPAVWAIDEAHSPLSWFPRDCPRATVWARSSVEASVLGSGFATTSTRIHAIEFSCFDRFRTVDLFRYELPAEPFSAWEEADGQYVSSSAVVPVDVHPVGDLLRQHVEAGIELRLSANLWPFWTRVVGSGLPHSGVRLHNATVRPAEQASGFPSPARGIALVSR